MLYFLDLIVFSTIRNAIEASNYVPWNSLHLDTLSTVAHTGIGGTYHREGLIHDRQQGWEEAELKIVNWGAARDEKKMKRCLC